MEYENCKQVTEEHIHKSNAMCFVSWAEISDNFTEKAELYKKAAEELKRIGDKENIHKLMATHYLFLSLCAENKTESERYQLLASGETKLGWLYLTQIAFNEFKKSKGIDGKGIDGKGIDGKGIDGKGIDGHLLESTIELYNKHLRHKNKQFPVYSIYMCGDITDATKQIMADMSDYFKFSITSFQRGEFKNTPKFKEEIKKNDFVLMELDEDIDGELFYELGLIAGMEKPIIILVSRDVNSFDKFIPKVATITSSRKLALVALKLFSVIKSGESLEIRDIFWKGLLF